MTAQKFSFHNIANFLTVAVALCAMAAVFVSGEIDGANCDTEGVWSMGTRTMGMTASAAAAPWNGTADITWYNAISTDFTITTPEQLAGLATLVNGGTQFFSGKTITLLNDIDLGGNPNNWMPIGTTSPNDRPFSGTFDGGGHNISNLYISRSTTEHVGLFGYIGSGATVKNVKIVNGILSGDIYVGGVVGENYNGTVNNCSNAGSVTGRNYVGGMVGLNLGMVSNCSNTGSVTGSGVQVGGMVGRSSGTVNNCSNTGSVSGDNYVGGVVGQNYGMMSNCSNTGSVSVSTMVVGVVGFNNSGTVANCEWLTGTAGQGVGGGTGSTTTTEVMNTSDLSIVGVTVSPAQIKIDGNTAQLTATTHPTGATSPDIAVTWSEANPLIATVNTSGLVTGVAIGNTTITVRTQTAVLGGNQAIATATVEVLNITPSSDPIKEMNDKLSPSGVQVAIINSADFPLVNAHVETAAPAILCYEPSGKPAGVVEVDISDPNALLQMQYSLKLTEAEISSRSNAVGRPVDTAKLFSRNGTPNESSIQEFFSVFVIQKEILQGARRGQLARLLGAGREEILTPQRAIAEGSLTMMASSDKTVQIDFRYMVRDGDYSPSYDAARRQIIIGDGLADKKIIDPLWVSMRKLTDRERGVKIDGGSGCAVVSTPLWWLLTGVIPLVVRRRK